MRNDVDYKVHKSCFGDILPYVLTRALAIDLLILNNASSRYFCDFISNSDDSMCTLPLPILVRNDKHYDAIVERMWKNGPRLVLLSKILMYLRNMHRMIW